MILDWVAFFFVSTRTPLDKWAARRIMEWIIRETECDEYEDDTA